MRNRMVEDDRYDNYMVRSIGDSCRHKTALQNKIMITKLAHGTRNRSGKVGVWMIRNSGGGKDRTTKAMKGNYMKVADGKRKGTPVGTKREPNVMQSVGITKKASVLEYVLSETPVSLLSITVDSMDMLDYSEIPENKKGRSKISLPSVTCCESMMGWSQEVIPARKEKDSRDCSVGEVVETQNNNPMVGAEEKRGSGDPKMKAMTQYLTQVTEGLIHLLYGENGEQS